MKKVCIPFFLLMGSLYPANKPRGRIELSHIFNQAEQDRLGITPLGNSDQKVPIFDITRRSREVYPGRQPEQEESGWGSYLASWLPWSFVKQTPMSVDDHHDSVDEYVCVSSPLPSCLTYQQYIVNRPLFNAVVNPESTKQDIACALQCGADINGCDSEGNTPVHLAAKYNSVEKLKFLLEQGASPCKSNNEEVFPLMMAIDNGSVEAVSLLLQHGALLSDVCTFSYSAQGSDPLLDLTLGKCTMLEYVMLKGSFSVAKIVVCYCDQRLFFSIHNLSELVAERVKKASRHRGKTEEANHANEILALVNGIITSPGLLGSALEDFKSELVAVNSLKNTEDIFI